MLQDFNGIVEGSGAMDFGSIDQEGNFMATSKKASTRTSPPKGGARRDARAGSKPGQGLQKAVRPSAELAAIVGREPLPRTQITKKLWDYIKAHNLQDPQNKRQINADTTLKPIFGGKTSISMFELAKQVSQHVQ
jgi:upstream activation factor subunit UAF30